MQSLSVIRNSNIGVNQKFEVYGLWTFSEDLKPRTMTTSLSSNITRFVLNDSFFFTCFILFLVFYASFISDFGAAFTMQKDTKENLWDGLSPTMRAKCRYHLSDNAKNYGGEAHIAMFCNLELLTLLQNATTLGQKVLGPKRCHWEQRWRFNRLNCGNAIMSLLQAQSIHCVVTVTYLWM